MTLSVLVPTWRRPAELARCLEGLAALSARPDEVVVVGRKEDEATRAALERVGAATGLDLRSVWVERPGVVSSLNAGLDAVSGELVAITDDDAVPRRDWLERMVAHLERDPGLGGVGGRDWVHQEGAVLDDGRPTVGKIHWYGRVVGNHHLGVGGPREVDVLKGANMGFRRAALLGTRLDEGLRGSGMQLHWELGLCLAVKRAGWRLLYDPAVAVDHYPAPRPEHHQRNALALEVLEQETYNEAYELARWLPAWRRLSVLAYGFLVGTRDAPGLVVGALAALGQGRHPGAFRTAIRARTHALRAARADGAR
jgi:cellulose synthase/poly-beta-1,6-N-acetylglucosamine synthase-like glycosyltransferase